MRTADILDGRLAARVLRRRIRHLVGSRRQPIILATILVGQRFDSALYIKLKTRAAGQVGIQTKHFHLPATASQSTLHRLIGRLNKDRRISGILLQLPLPHEFNADRAVAVIDPAKDVDGFHPANRAVVPPPVAAVLRLLGSAAASRSGRAMILAKPSVFSQRLTDELGRRGYSVSIANPVKKIPSATDRADLVITARGRGPLLRASHIKRGAVVIDVGTRRQRGRVSGDVHPSAWHKARAISPVPGGVGPLTVAYLLYNTYRLASKKSRTN